ncbi:FxSxx-COOH system tetratricopeptide repeat protein [Streptomyces sp. NBC_01236]|uniref:FxSxx-COOH system tetratricopeptide repeat protein n=1 Tax=Streptomyces sp. NBC_01236 TaxID=2903789 RepID=UPI002E12816C|nr:FxSxx-COOH system tetratricopeptide repeat protein [Streptomyces sp. NBC_01236]
MPAEGTLVVGPLPQEPLAFQERLRLMEELDRAMELRGASTACALTGGRGVGKTQLAGAYARSRIEAGWRVVAWIVAEEPGQIIAGLDELAEAAGVKGSIQDAELAAAAARQWLERLPEPSLLVLDNVGDPDEVREWLPRLGRTRTLMTSTTRSVAHLGATVDIGMFSVDEAVAFLREVSMVGEPEAGTAAAEELVLELGCMPLALAQAAWVIRMQGLAFTEYLERFRHRPTKEATRRVPGEPYASGVAEALLSAIAHAETGDHSETVRRATEYISLMSPSGVHRDDLRAAMPDRDADEIAAVVGQLTEACLVTLSLDGGTVVMHRLVQRIVRDRLQDDGRLQARMEEMATVLSGLLPDTDGALMLNDGDHGLTDHILALWAAAEPLGDAARRGLLQLRRTAVWLLVNRAELDRACRLGREVLADHERIFPSSDSSREAKEETLDARESLMRAYMAAEQYASAVPLAEQSVVDHGGLFGPDDRRTLEAVNTLGYVLEVAGRLDEALTVHTRNLADSIRVNGPGHETTLRVQINLASTFRSQGDSPRALVLFEKNVADNERCMGPDHRSTLNARGELARMYERVGRSAEAVVLYEILLADLRRLYPDAHRSFLWWGRYQAQALQSSGRTEEAIDELERLLERSEHGLGSDHPETLSIRIFLARALMTARQYSNAIALFERCVADRERVLGPHNRRTLNARRNLGLTLLAAGRRSHAIGCLESVLADYERAIGAHHPFTEGARADLVRARAARSPLRRLLLPAP